MSNDNKRRIVQIATTSDKDCDVVATVALCNDGTLWELSGHAYKEWGWQRLPDIPQGAANQAAEGVKA